jgi:hypothetical protein
VTSYNGLRGNRVQANYATAKELAHFGVTADEVAEVTGPIPRFGDPPK